ncbi:hypothetical protein H7H51_06965, partial [Mycolicibacterium farcinogenes]|nr:hypothetical protein [Mycolicibacterium farcinogenes]
RIAALNIDQAQAAAIVDQAVGILRTSPDPTVRDTGEFLAGAQRTAHHSRRLTSPPFLYPQHFQRRFARGIPSTISV